MKNLFDPFQHSSHNLCKCNFLTFLPNGSKQRKKGTTTDERAHFESLWKLSSYCQVKFTSWNYFLLNIWNALLIVSMGVALYTLYTQFFMAVFAPPTPRDELQTMKVWSIKEQRIKAERRLDGTRKTWYMWMWIIILVIFISLLFTFSTSHITHHITGTMMMWYVRRRIGIERFFTVCLRESSRWGLVQEEECEPVKY